MGNACNSCRKEKSSEDTKIGLIEINNNSGKILQSGTRRDSKSKRPEEFIKLTTVYNYSNDLL